jgi:hypothetical protein
MSNTRNGSVQLIGQPACRLGFADARRADQQHGRPGHAAIAQAGQGEVVTQQLGQFMEVREGLGEVAPDRAFQSGGSRPSWRLPWPARLIRSAMACARLNLSSPFGRWRSRNASSPASSRKTMLGTGFSGFCRLLLNLLRFGFTRDGLIFSATARTSSVVTLPRSLQHLLYTLFDDVLAAAAHFFGKQSLDAVMLRAALRADAVSDNLYTADRALLLRKVLGLGNQIEHSGCALAVAARRLVMDGQAIPVAAHGQ